MNLVGKVLIMLIFVMSLVFMSFSVAVYATHKNWKEVVDNPSSNGNKPLGLKFQVQYLEKENSEKLDACEALAAQLKQERERHLQAIGKLERKRQDLLVTIEGLEKTISDKQVAYSEAHESFLAIQANYSALDASVKALQTDLLAANDARDVARRAIILKTSELHNSVMERARLAQRSQDLTEQLVQAGGVLKMFGLKPDPDAYKRTAPPFTVHGSVIALGQGTIGISVGADDGLMKDHEFIIYRIQNNARKLVGRAVVTKVTDSNRAVCRIMPEYQKDHVQGGDRVVSIERTVQRVAAGN